VPSDWHHCLVAPLRPAPAADQQNSVAPVSIVTAFRKPLGKEGVASVGRPPEQTSFGSDMPDSDEGTLIYDVHPVGRHVRVGAMVEG